MADVAARAEVSRTTASYILGAARGGFAPETVARVTQAAKELGYRPNPIAQSLRTGRTRLFGLVVPADVGSSGQHARCRTEVGIATQMREHHMDVVQVIVSRDADSGISRVSELLKTGLIDGLIVNAPKEIPVISWLRDQGAPFVVIGNPGLSDITSVDMDNVAVGQASARHLIEHGHANLVYIAPPKDMHHSQDRAAGFTEFCVEAGMTKEQVRVVHAQDSLAGGYNAMREVLASASGVSGVCAGDDSMACGAVTAIIEAGLTVPGDISVLGCNNDCLACTDQDFLSTVDLDFAALGALAARKLVSLLEGRPTVRREMIGCRLIQRKSSCAASSRL